MEQSVLHSWLKMSIFNLIQNSLCFYQTIERIKIPLLAFQYCRWLLTAYPTILCRLSSFWKSLQQVYAKNHTFCKSGCWKPQKTPAGVKVNSVCPIPWISAKECRYVYLIPIRRQSNRCHHVQLLYCFYKAVVTTELPNKFYAVTFSFGHATGWVQRGRSSRTK